MPDIFLCEITDNRILTDAVFSITVACRQLANESVAGQFLHIKSGKERFLRRPISICNVRDNKINFVFEVKGEGTRWLSEQKPGHKLDVLGPLGRGFIIPEDKFIIIGGGVGTPPMLFAAESGKSGIVAVLGFRSADRVILVDDFKAVCDDVYITTDDGSVGIHGAVTKPLEELLKSGEYKSAMSCGQLSMQKSVAEMCKQYNVPCQVSLEERMGCGIGACLVCTCATELNGIKQMSRVCIDGPVFDASEVIWQ